MSSSKSRDDIPRVGDIVKLPQHRGEVTGIIVDDTCETGWLDVLLEGGEVMKWPAVQLKIVAGELSDEQLENVVGGMSPQKFEEWVARKLNEGG